MPEVPRISEAEWVVMRAVWDRHPRTAREIAGELQPLRGWSERTIKTLLNRLVKKGALGFDLDGKRYLYYPLISREACVRAASHSFMERVFGGAPSPLLAYFLEESQLSRQEIESLRRLLEKKECT